MNDGGGQRSTLIVVALIAAAATLGAAFIQSAKSPGTQPTNPAATSPATDPPGATTTAPSVPPSVPPSTSAPASDAPAGAPAARIEPDVIASGEVFTVTGSGFPPGRQVTLGFDGAFFAFVVADSQGRFYFEGPLDPLYCGAPWSEFLATGGDIEVYAEVRLCP